MKRMPKIDVVLTREACDLLKDEAARLFLKDGTYINCDSIA